MNRLVIGLLVTLLAVGIAAAQTEESSSTPSQAARFRALDVYLETGEVALAAYQVEIRDRSGRMKIVGIEGGDHAAFEKPPYYDPAAMMGERIVLGAFSTEGALPTGNVRVARIHVRITGDAEPDIVATCKVAADAQGRKIPAVLTTTWRETR